jgi:hypothetical protein
MSAVAGGFETGVSFSGLFSECVGYVFAVMLVLGYSETVPPFACLLLVLRRKFLFSDSTT